jgi:hypothetical protein
MADRSTRFLAQLMMSRPFGRLATAERDAVIEALLLTVVPAGRVPDVDREALRRELLFLPWAWEGCESTVDGLVDRSAAKLTRLEDPALLEPFGRVLAKRLARATLRANVAKMMVLLYYADGGTAQGLAALEPLGASLARVPVRHIAQSLSK